MKNSKTALNVHLIVNNVDTNANGAINLLEIEKRI